MSLELVARIAAHHGLAGTPIELPETGMVNDAFRIGEHVVRIAKVAGPFPPEEAVGDAERERFVGPLVEAAGIRTPRLVAAEIGGALTPRPYTIYHHVDGVLLGAVASEPDAMAATHRELGGELARIAQIAIGDDIGPLRVRTLPDAHATLARTVAAGRTTAADAAMVTDWLARLAPQLGTPGRVLLHRDIHPWNLLVDPATAELRAILGWGDASVGDPAQEMMAMPVCALPAMLDGYRAAGGAIDPGFVARAVWGGIALACWELRELDPSVFDRRWWRTPPGGWAEHRAIVARAFPELA